MNTYNHRIQYIILDTINDERGEGGDRVKADKMGYTRLIDCCSFALSQVSDS